MIEMANPKLHIHFYGFDCGAKLKESKYIKIFPDTFNIEKPIGEADEVAGILLGRVNLEANSCRVPSMIYDPNTLESKKFLLSEKEFDKKHNIKNVAKQIIKVYENYRKNNHHNTSPQPTPIIGESSSGCGEISNRDSEGWIVC
jgi:hypothetical protein